LLYLLHHNIEPQNCGFPHAGIKYFIAIGESRKAKYNPAQNAIQAVLEPFSAYLLATTNTAIAGFSEQSGASCRDLWGRVGWAGCGVGNST